MLGRMVRSNSLNWASSSSQEKVAIGDNMAAAPPLWLPSFKKGPPARPQG
jgi:hypothetical protein